VSSGPVMENVMSWKDIDMFKFPAPLWHDEDGGRYIGTASLVITKDLESDWVNVGTYRVQVHDKNVLGFYASPGKHSRIHREKYYARGEACPVVMSFGHDPTIFLSACLQMSPGVCEYDIAGGIKGEPIEVIKGEVTGLPFPANSEIVIEGFSPADENMVEGPFGEYGGYYGSAERPEPIIKVERVYYRNNPIITGCPPSRPPSDTSFFHGPCTSAVIWDNMERAGVPDIRGVWQFEAATNWAFTAVSIKQRYPGHAKQAGILASQVQGGAYLGRYVVVVDDDIDPSNINDILWALGTRSDPERSCEILRRCWAGPLDTATPPGSPNLNSRLIIDACKPYEWMKDFAKELHIRPEVRQRVLEKWVNSLKT
ncbi:MAG: UbiD family decarboxylase, partial [Dehalococcoidia bacterium]|nr:UbiD family decarboxylase [Dehalococcoidia bacterium]